MVLEYPTAQTRAGVRHDANLHNQIWSCQVRTYLLASGILLGFKTFCAAKKDPEWPRTFNLNAFGDTFAMMKTYQVKHKCAMVRDI